MKRRSVKLVASRGDEAEARAKDRVEELQGMFGPFQFPELLLQRIWAERAFSMEEARLADGRALKIEYPGRWNRQGGPDFKQARLRIEGQVVHGDVEVHLHEGDWRAHGHREDVNYNQVVLHVVLFEPRAGGTTTDGASDAIPVLVLLPRLWYSLEEYAADAAVTAIAARPADQLAEAWLRVPVEAAEGLLRKHSFERWRAKVRYAGIRIAKLGWRAACHHTALEILGYRFNRIGMLQAAERWPLARWESAVVDSEAVFRELAEFWRLQAVRPMNHPRRRLQAYAGWVGRTEDWPARWLELAEIWPKSQMDGSVETGIGAQRRQLGYTKWWRAGFSAIGATDFVTGPRADNLWGDGLLPLLAATGALPDALGFKWWFASRPGDQAAGVVQAIRLCGIANAGTNPLAWGHVQGLIGWQAEVTATEMRRT